MIAACSIPPESEWERQGAALRPVYDPDHPGLSPGEVREVMADNAAGQEARARYLNQKYPNERGQSQSWKKTLYAGMLDIFATAKNDGAFTWEYCSLFYVDKYGYFYYTAPVRGWMMSDGSARCEVPGTTVLRPEVKARAYAHSHPWGRSVKSADDTANAAALSQADPLYEYWTILSNGELYYYSQEPGQQMGPKLYGKIDKGHIITAYNDIRDIHREGYDPYAQQPGDSGSGIWSTVWKSLVGIWVVSGTVAAWVLGGASTPSDGCCYGPPASGYDPGSDPTQVCRRADGDNCT